VGISLGLKLESSLSDLLRQRKEFLLNHWCRCILDEYAGETASFLKKQSDRFANPVAYALRAAAEAIYQALIDDRDVDHSALDYAMKIKAVQENDPIKGIAFIHILKEAVGRMPASAVPENELADFNSRIDRIASVASEMFVIHRAKIADVGARCNVHPVFD
jgi:hypothetical protein